MPSRAPIVLHFFFRLLFYHKYKDNTFLRNVGGLLTTRRFIPESSTPVLPFPYLVCRFVSKFIYVRIVLIESEFYPFLRYICSFNNLTIYIYSYTFKIYTCDRNWEFIGVILFILSVHNMFQAKYNYINYISWESYRYYNGSVVSQFVSYYPLHDIFNGKWAFVLKMNWL
jgi:hypothetical protein